MARIGILGGSFNPIHNGHLHLADAAVKQLSLDRLLLMPAGEAPHKSTAAYAAAEHRLAMCEVACAGRKKLSVCRYELEKTGKSYTVETLRWLRTQYPNDELFWLVGGDMLTGFTRWYRWEEILTLCTLAAVSRGEDEAALRRTAEHLGAYGTVLVLSVAPVLVSSTEIREKVKSGGIFSCYLPENVVQYIRCHRLYADTDATT